VIPKRLSPEGAWAGVSNAKNQGWRPDVDDRRRPKGCWAARSRGLQASYPAAPWPPTTPIDFDDCCCLPGPTAAEQRTVRRRTGTAAFATCSWMQYQGHQTAPRTDLISCWYGARPRAVRRLGPALRCVVVATPTRASTGFRRPISRSPYAASRTTSAIGPATKHPARWLSWRRLPLHRHDPGAAQPPLIAHNSERIDKVLRAHPRRSELIHPHRCDDGSPKRSRVVPPTAMLEAAHPS